MVPQLVRATSAGEVVRSREVSGFILTETSYRMGFRAPCHSHELGFFFAVVDGAFTEALGSETQDYGSLALAYRPAGVAHAHACEGGGRCFNIYPVEPERFQEYTLALRAPADVHGALLPWLVTRLYREFGRGEDASPLAMEGLALEILAEATRPASSASTRRPPRWLAQARELLHARFSESITVAEVARCLDVNPAYLARAFHEHYHCTMGDYLRRLRVEFASRLLCAGDAPLSAIALDAGFVDQSHFTKTFKRLTGMTPAQFRADAFLR